MSLSAQLGLYDPGLIDDQELRAEFILQLEQAIEDMIEAGVMISVTEWVSWSQLERRLYLELKRSSMSSDAKLDELADELNLPSSLRESARQLLGRLA